MNMVLTRAEPKETFGVLAVGHHEPERMEPCGAHKGAIKRLHSVLALLECRGLQILHFAC